MPLKGIKMINNGVRGKRKMLNSVLETGLTHWDQTQVDSAAVS